MNNFIQNLLKPYYENEDSSSYGSDKSTYDSDSTYDSSSTDNDAIDQYSDGLAIFGLVVLFISIGGFIAFVIHQRYKTEIDERNHPYHQQYQHHKQDKMEQLENEELVREIEWNAAIDFQAYTCA